MCFMGVFLVLLLGEFLLLTLESGVEYFIKR